MECEKTGDEYGAEFKREFLAWFDLRGVKTLEDAWRAGAVYGYLEGRAVGARRLRQKIDAVLAQEARSVGGPLVGGVTGPIASPRPDGHGKA